MIRLDGLTIGPLATPALRNVVAEFPVGTLSAIVGPAGSGKTRLLETVLGLRKPVEGTVQLAGLDPAAKSIAVRQHVSFVPASAAVLPHLTAIEQVRLVVRVAGGPRLANSVIVGALRLSDVPDRTFSTRGSALTTYQRLCLWLAIHRIRRASALLLDDPAITLTAGQSQDFARLLRELAAESTTILVATRDLAFATEAADRSYRIEGRRMLLHLERPQVLQARV